MRKLVITFATLLAMATSALADCSIVRGQHSNDGVAVYSAPSSDAPVLWNIYPTHTNGRATFVWCGRQSYDHFGQRWNWVQFTTAEENWVHSGWIPMVD